MLWPVSQKFKWIIWWNSLILRKFHKYIYVHETCEIHAIYIRNKVKKKFEYDWGVKGGLVCRRWIYFAIILKLRCLYMKYWHLSSVNDGHVVNRIAIQASMNGFIYAASGTSRYWPLAHMKQQPDISKITLISSSTQKELNKNRFQNIQWASPLPPESACIHHILLCPYSKEEHLGEFVVIPIKPRVWQTVMFVFDEKINMCNVSCLLIQWESK